MLVALPTFVLLLAECSYKEGPPTPWGHWGPALLWAVSLPTAGALGIALSRAFGPAAGFLLAVGGIAIARAGLLPEPAAGLFPPAASLEVEPARVGAALAGSLGWLAAAAALRAR
jgi:hypothetical protein